MTIKRISCEWIISNSDWSHQRHFTHISIVNLIKIPRNHQKETFQCLRSTFQILFTGDGGVMLICRSAHFTLSSFSADVSSLTMRITRLFTKNSWPVQVELDCSSSDERSCRTESADENAEQRFGLFTLNFVKRQHQLPKINSSSHQFRVYDLKVS